MFDNAHFMYALFAAAIAVPFSWAMVRWHVLTFSGALMAAAIGVTVVAAMGGWWLLPLFLFLGSGVLLGRLNRGARTDAKHGRPRDAMQVFCSGGVYALLALCGDRDNGMLWMSASIGIAMCDTWASETGMYAKGPTWNLITFRKVPPGLSGGVSVAGTLGGAAGAVLVAILCTGLAQQDQPRGGAVGALVLIAMGGMLLDSLLGASLQVKYDDGNGPSDSGTRRSSGITWITNDVVNLLSNVLTLLLAWIVMGT
jgi:uncharacterized protein (TIGR00297 family)